MVDTLVDAHDDVVEIGSVIQAVHDATSDIALSRLGSVQEFTSSLDAKELATIGSALKELGATLTSSPQMASQLQRLNQDLATVSSTAHGLLACIRPAPQNGPPPPPEPAPGPLSTVTPQAEPQ